MNKMKICIDCKHFKKENAGAIWYNAFCHHPSVKREETIDPTFGHTVYKCDKDTSDEKYPYTRDINKEGKCELYEKKSGVFSR